MKMFIFSSIFTSNANNTLSFYFLIFFGFNSLFFPVPLFKCVFIVSLRIIFIYPRCFVHPKFFSKILLNFTKK